ncbi:kinase-like domain-containing protein [Tirmania nivea]|nr:kinase-like domain-containing protein [Tirmania nivea]
MAPPPAQTQTAVIPSPQNPNDPHRFSVYERVTMVGEGTYGKVYKARNKNTHELVALKRIRMESERDGFPITAVREMKLLESLKHVNIVSLLETMVERVPTKTHSDFYMVFEYMDHDLTGILNHPTFQLEPGHIKHLAKQFFEGLQYLHHRGVLHRDIKASNILLDSNGLLKLADFGLARFYQKRKKGLDYTNRIITLWYRPPEILLGDTAYGPAVDIWSAGCVFAELFTRAAVFPGSTEINQLDVIYDLLGTPTKEDWPMLKKMPWYELLKPPTRKEPRFDEKYNSLLPPAALELVKWIFSFDPEKRPSAEQVLQHAYFTSEEPEAKPCSLAHLKGDWHEFEAKSRKRKERQAAKEREAQASRREASSTGSGGPSTESRQR